MYVENDVIFEEEHDSDDDRKKSRVNKDKPLYALVLTPTRELAIQVKDHIDQAAKYTDIKVQI